VRGDALSSHSPIKRNGIWAGVDEKSISLQLPCSIAGPPGKDCLMMRS
jgi:hypothetical protein